MFVIHSIRFPACLCVYLRLDDPEGMLRPSSLPTANEYLFAHLLFFIAKEHDEPTSSSFANKNARIDASIALLEALITL